MAVSAGTAYLDIVPRLQRNFSRDLTRQMFGPAGQAADKTGTQAGQRFGSGFTKGTKQGARPAVGMFRQLRGQMADAFGGRAAATLGAGVIAAGLYQTVQAASDLNETISKTRAVFGPSAKQVEKFGESAAESLKMSRQQALEAASTFGNLFVSMKIGQQPAAEMSTKMVQLAADLASFNNASPEETLDALRSGLTGETEPLKRFGVNLNEANLKAEAMRLGLGKIGPTLTASQKAQAAYSLILQQTKTAQGDAARTGDQLAGQQRELAAKFKDSQAALGTALLPVMLTAADAANDLFGGFNKLNEATGGLAAKGLLAGGGLVAVGIAAFKVAGYVRMARDAWVAYRTAAITTAAANMLLTRQQILLGGATVATGEAAQTAGAKFIAFGAYTTAAAAVIGTLVYNLNELKTKGLQEGRFLDPASLAIKKVGQAFGLWKDKTAEQTTEQKTNTEATKLGKEASDAYGQALKAVAGGQQDTAAKTEVLTDKLKGLEDEFANQKQAVQDSIEAYDGLITKSKVTTEQVITDLKNQVSNFKTYSTDVKRLIKQGVDPAAIEELSKKGPEYVHRLAEGSNAQLKRYKGYWHDRQAEIKGSFAESMDLQYAKLKKTIEDMKNKINELSGKTIYLTAQAKVEISKRTRLYLSSVPDLKAYLAQRGARIPGYGGGDIVPAMLEPGEAVVPKHAARNPEFQSWAKAQGIPGFQRGGPIGQIPRFDDNVGRAHRVIGQRFTNYLAERIGKGLGKELDKSVGQLGGLSGPGGWQWQMRVLRNQFPGLQLISGFRPGAVTHATGRQSYHAVGRAVDVPPRMDVFNWIRGTYGKRTKELIFSPAGMRQVHNGAPHMYTGVTRADHWNHVHWAYDKGGMLPTGTSLATNNTGRPEPVGFDYDKLAAAIVRAQRETPPVVYLDRQKVSRAVRDGQLWEARR